MLLLHVPVPPDAVRLARVVVAPTHTELAPVISPATGVTFTVMVIVVNADPHNALVSVYVTIVVPPLTPVTTPVMALTEPTVVLLLVQAPDPPDAVALLKVIVDPEHTVFKPVIAPASGDTFTVIFVVVVADPQKTLVSVKVIFVFPGLTP